MAKEGSIKTYSADELRDMAERGQDLTDLARVQAMSEADLDRAIEADADWRDVPQDWFRGAEAVMPRPKVPISIRLDADLVDFFRGQGRGWQTRLNAVLR